MAMLLTPATAYRSPSVKWIKSTVTAREANPLTSMAAELYFTRFTRENTLNRTTTPLFTR